MIESKRYHFFIKIMVICIIDCIFRSLWERVEKEYRYLHMSDIATNILKEYVTEGFENLPELDCCKGKN